MSLLKVLLFGFVFCAFWWLVVFMNNPYSWCKDHPDRDLRAQYYLCEPFGFDFPKGLIENENKIDLPIFNEKRVYVPSRTSKEFSENRKNEKCSDSAFRKTEHGKEVCGDR